MRRLLALALIAAAAGGCGGSTRTSEHTPLVIGALFSTTGKGNSIGPQQIAGARLAVTELNRAGGVDGSPIRLDVRDDQTDPVHATTALRDLVGTKHVLGLLGPTLSIVAFKVDPIADQLKTPVVAVSNTAAGISGDCAYPCTWIWRASLPESVAVPAAVQAYTNATHARSAVVVSTTPDALGEQEAAAATKAFRDAGVPRVTQVQIPADALDVQPYVVKILAANPSAVFIGSSFGTSIADVVHATRAEGYSGGFLAGNVLNSETTAELAGPAGTGALAGAAWSEDNAFPANATFITKYRQRYGIEPDEFAAQAYTGVQILAEAMHIAHLAGSTEPIEQQRARLQEALGKVALTTPLGPFRFTDDHSVRQIVWIRALDGHGGSGLAGFCDPEC